MNKKELENALIFPQGEKNPYGAYFTGQSYLEGMIADKDLPFGVGNVTFEPGCRNHWHIHKDGYQVLLVTAGEGWYQEEGKEAQLLHAGIRLLLMQELNIGMERQKIAGSVMWPLLREKQFG